MTPVGTALHFRRERPKTKNLAFSRCCFADDGNEMDKSEKRTCRACEAIVLQIRDVLVAVAVVVA